MIKFPLCTQVDKKKEMHLFNQCHKETHLNQENDNDGNLPLDEIALLEYMKTFLVAY